MSNLFIHNHSSSTTSPHRFIDTNWAALPAIWGITAAVIALATAWDESIIRSWTQICGALSVLQLVFVLKHSFKRSWLGVLTYTFHWIFIGGAALALAFADTQMDQVVEVSDYRIWILGLAGLLAQISLGFIALADHVFVTPRAFKYPPLALVMLACGLAAFIKFALYINQIASLGGHLAIYTEGGTIRDASPPIVRILAKGAPLVALIVISQRTSPWWLLLLAIASITVEIATGTRSRPIFLLSAALVLN